jgi:predicted RNase H-like HicB family nuclease
MTKVYPAIIHEENGSYWVEFPDLEGCSTYGETLEETLDLASEALGLYLVSLSEDGTPLPEASDLSSIICKDGHAIYITTDINKYRRDTKAVKKMLSIPAWLAKEAEARNLSLSKVLQEALQERLHMT